MPLPPALCRSCFHFGFHGEGTRNINKFDLKRVQRVPVFAKKKPMKQIIVRSPPPPPNFNVDWLVLHECRGGAKKKPILVSQVRAEITTLKLGGGGAHPEVKVRTARSAFFSQTPVRAFAWSSCKCRRSASGKIIRAAFGSSFFSGARQYVLYPNHPESRFKKMCLLMLCNFPAGRPIMPTSLNWCRIVSTHCLGNNIIPSHDEGRAGA